MSRTRLSKISMTPQGTWDSTTEYKRLDVVSNAGASWLAKQDNVGVTPVEGEDWMNLVNITKDSVVDALGYTPASGEWELLNTLTTTKEIVYANFEKDSDGNTLRLAKSFGIVSLPSKQTLSKIYLGQYFRWIAIPTDLSAGSVHFFMEAMGDRFRGYAQPNTYDIETKNMSDYGKIQWGCGSNTSLVSGAITSVCFYNQYNWPVGTKFFVYGVRA